MVGSYFNNCIKRNGKKEEITDPNFENHCCIQLKFLCAVGPIDKAIFLFDINIVCLAHTHSPPLVYVRENISLVLPNPKTIFIPD